MENVTEFSFKSQNKYKVHLNFTSLADFEKNVQQWESKFYTIYIYI
jgi:hypothetical protein